MGIRQKKGVPSHWNYFLAVEHDMLSMSRWIEFDKANSECYSIELARLLMMASAETDVVAKMLCRSIDESSHATSINRYQEVIVQEYPSVHKEEVELPKYGLTLTPWMEWKSEASPPSWWKANNKVKHHRSEHFSRATLKNSLDSVAGLFVLLLIYYGRHRRSIAPPPAELEPKRSAYLDGNVLVFRQGNR